MLIKKALLAAAAALSLAAPAIASAQDFGGYHDGFYRDGYRYEQRGDYGRYEQHRNFAWRQIEREREIRRELWRARFEHRHEWRHDHGFYGEHRGWEDYRSY